MRNLRAVGLLATLAVVVAACESDAPTASIVANDTLQPSESPALVLSQSKKYGQHRPILAYAEIITDPLSGEAGRVVWIQKDLGNGQLTHDYVYGDPRRASFNGGAAGVTYGVNESFLSGDSELEDQLGWLHDSVLIWDAQRCSDLTLSENDISPGLMGSVATFFEFGFIPLPEADLTQVGFLGKGVIFPAGTSTLGVTFTLLWSDEDGNLTDIDGNGKADVAFREIYYNDQYEWADNGIEGSQPDGVRYFDFPSVAIHEVGHGFSSAHFGNIGVKDGFLFARPRAVMNAIYGGTLRDLTGRDAGAHCSNWAQWPKN